MKERLPQCKKLILLLLVATLILGGLSVSCGPAEAPTSAEEYLNRGLAYRSEGQLDEAIADFNKAIELDPNLAWAYFNRGAAYLQKQELDKAITNLEKCIELSRDPSLTQEAEQLLEELRT